MKPIKIILIIGSIIVFTLASVILITRAIINPPASWWWTIGFILFYLFCGLIGAVISLVLRLRKRKPEEIKIDPDNAEKNAIIKLLYDNDNPDNFIREDRVILRVGQAGAERTPILWLTGRGVEKYKKIDILVHLNRPETEILYLFDKNNNYVREIARTFADNPAEIETLDKSIGIDEFGRPVTTTRIKRTTIAEKKEEEEKEKAEEANAL